MEALRARAKSAHRSLSGEILFRLRRSLEGSTPIGGASVREEAAVQADAWERLTGHWVADGSVAEEIEALYAARSGGRDIEVSW